MGDVKRVEVVWPRELVERIDRAAGDVPRSRWLTRAVEAMLLIVEEGQSLEKASAGEVAGRSVESGPAPPRVSERRPPSIRDTWAR